MDTHCRFKYVRKKLSLNVPEAADKQTLCSLLPPCGATPGLQRANEVFQRSYYRYVNYNLHVPSGD